jgi:hypothetical protein
MLPPIDRFMFPSLFRDSSDHHVVIPEDGMILAGPGFHPSLGIPLIITHLGPPAGGPG